jgi:hypothetical protein
LPAYRGTTEVVELTRFADNCQAVSARAACPSAQFSAVALPMFDALGTQEELDVIQLTCSWARAPPPN